MDTELNKPNEIVFCKDKYKTESDMWKAIADTLRTLTNEEYIIVFRCDERGLGIYVLEYDYIDESLCDVHPYWIEPDLIPPEHEQEEEKGE